VRWLISFLLFLASLWFAPQAEAGFPKQISTYTRGTDLSGSFQGAGGIGGLLARTDRKGSFFYHSDGGGNVTALVDNQQTLVGRYLYGPFGNLLGMWGPIAPHNLMRFNGSPHP
jgi:hypothetical protein